MPMKIPDHPLAAHMSGNRIHVLTFARPSSAPYSHEVTQARQALNYKLGMLQIAAMRMYSRSTQFIIMDYNPEDDREYISFPKPLLHHVEQELKAAAFVMIRDSEQDVHVDMREKLLMGGNLNKKEF